MTIKYVIHDNGDGTMLVTEYGPTQKTEDGLTFKDISTTVVNAKNKLFDFDANSLGPYPKDR